MNRVSMTYGAVSNVFTFMNFESKVRRMPMGQKVSIT